MANYPEGGVIPRNLPISYQPAGTESVPEGQQCSTCKYYKGGCCKVWLEKVRYNWWCSSWTARP